MRHTVIFKGVTHDSMYHWENIADESPKQLFSCKSEVIAKIRPKINQQYIIHYDRLDGNIMVTPRHIQDHYTTCGYWKVVGNELVFKKGKNKGLTVSQYTSAFPNNPSEEMSFVKSITALYLKTNNIFTRNNILRIFNSGAINYCEIFGYGGSIIQLGSYKGFDIKTVTKENHIKIKNRLEYFRSKVVSPISAANCDKWIDFIDGKYKKA